MNATDDYKDLESNNSMPSPLPSLSSQATINSPDSPMEPLIHDTRAKRRRVSDHPQCMPVAIDYQCRYKTRPIIAQVATEDEKVKAMLHSLRLDNISV